MQMYSLKMKELFAINADTITSYKNRNMVL